MEWKLWHGWLFLCNDKATLTIFDFDYESFRRIKRLEHQFIFLQKEQSTVFRFMV